MLGGIIEPSCPPQEIAPRDNRSAYLCFRISGKATATIVAAVATGLPQTAAKPAQAPMVAIASPPGRCPIHLLMVSKASELNPALPARMPMKVNSGMAVSKYLLDIA